MKVIVDKDGKFAFLFDVEEKQLGIDILLTIIPNNAEAEQSLANAIVSVKYGGVPLPDNVVRLY